MKKWTMKLDSFGDGTLNAGGLEIQITGFKIYASEAINAHNQQATNKSDGGISKRRVRPDQIKSNEYGQFKLSVYRSGGQTIYSFSKISDELPS